MEEQKGKTGIFNKRGVVAIGVTSTLCWVFAFLSAEIFGAYALTLFIWLPFVMGAASTLLYGFNNPTASGKLFGVSMWTLLVFCVGMLIFAWEGLICLLMAFPLGLLFTWLGHRVGRKILMSRTSNTSTAVTLLFLSVPSLLAFENAQPDRAETRAVQTSIIINAPPEQVWKNVIAFPELAAPTEFIFKTGIAYPINATIRGQGVGAVRHCNFSTGSFVEPITVWNEPNLLKFSVESQPEPMTEVSFYQIKPNHLHGYWVSKEGQFKLTRLPSGRTRLEGTTWYVNKIKPDMYWSLWSDYIVHKIHQRVLEHIKYESEL